MMKRSAGTVLLVALLACAQARAQAPARSAQMSAQEMAEFQKALTRTQPVKAVIVAGGRRKSLVLVGRTQERLAYTEDESSARQVLAVDRIEEAYFELDYDRAELHKALRARQWDRAAAILLPPVKPALFYLDLPENNAAQLVLDVGDYLMRSGQQQLRVAETDEQHAAALKKYEGAYAVLKYASQAWWYSGGGIARLKRIKCLLALGKPKTARRQFGDVDEPFPGDAAIGLYWLVKAELDVQKSDFRAAMDAAVKSVCYEHKDVDTFPDALLISARCYEEMQEWYRARDVYFEVARIFPRTDWADAAIPRLKFIMQQGFTAGKEQAPIESVFFAFQEDMNEVVTGFLADIEDRPTDEEAARYRVYKVEEAEEAEENE